MKKNKLPKMTICIKKEVDAIPSSVSSSSAKEKAYNYSIEWLDKAFSAMENENVDDFEKLAEDFANKINGKSMVIALMSMLELFDEMNNASFLKLRESLILSKNVEKGGITPLYNDAEINNLVSTALESALLNYYLQVRLTEELNKRIMD